MNQLDEIYDNERIEKDTFRSMRELSKYTQILSKENNLFVIIKNKIDQIKLLSPKSLFKISLLLDTLPEETVSFTYYTEEKKEEKEINNNNIIIPENKKPKKNEGIYIIDNIKKNIIKDKGNFIGKNHKLFFLIWGYLYILNFIISLNSLILFFAYLLISLFGKEYYISLTNAITIISLLINNIASNSGYKKIKGKKRVNFRIENILFICFLHFNIFTGFFWLFIYDKKNINMKLYSLSVIEIILILVDIIIIALIWLNIKMIEFYKEYSKFCDEGIPLVEV